MANPHDHPTALKDLQDSIYREKILRARSMTREERFLTGIQLTNEVSDRMLTGAMARLGTNNESLAKADLRCRLERIRKSQDHGFYSNKKPAA
ncbi:MAG: hypothetical protein ACSHX7_05060 [Luteolibacter sp.]